MLEAKFIGSYPELALCPKADKPEFAFAGRSNVGKSSLINMLVGAKNLAHVSGKPGKTQLLNFYSVNDEWHLVDFPGYGYAKTAKKTRSGWRKMVSDYLLERPTLQCAFVLIDATVPPQESDVAFINWLGENQVPFVIAYTKCDKLSTRQEKASIEILRQALGEQWNELPQEFFTSAERRRGKEEMLGFIDAVNKSVGR